MDRQAELLERLTGLLAALGFTPGEGDSVALAFILAKVVAEMRADLNRPELPEALEAAAVQRAAAEFLLAKKPAGGLQGIELEEAAVKQISEGDTTVAFAIGDASLTPEQRLDALIAHWLASGQELMACYRTLRW